MVGTSGGSATIRVEMVAPEDDRRIQQIIALGDKSTSTLGLLVPAAYYQAAEQQRLLAALDGDDLVGYALYRLPRQIVGLTHLCVDQTRRKGGIARLLVDDISARYPDRLGITASCRRDYGLADMWSRLGFVAQGERPGRGKDRHPLVVWWRDHGHPDLFSTVDTPALLTAAIDNNVLNDLHPDPVKPREGAHLSQGMLANWLADRLELVGTPQLLMEINDRNDLAERNRLRGAARGYRIVKADQNDVDELVRQLIDEVRTQLGKTLPTKRGDLGDLRYIAEAACASISVLVTRDEPLLKLSDVALDVCGVRILHPSEVATQIDELLQAQQYQPASLLGTSLLIEAIRSGTESQLVEAFLNRPDGERRSAFTSLLRELAGAHQDYDRRIVRTPDKNPLAVSVTRLNGDRLEVPLLRTAHHGLESTLARQLLFLLRKQSRDMGARLLVLTDPHLSASVRQAALAEGFRRHKSDLVALVVDVCAPADQVQQVTSRLTTHLGFPDVLLRPGLPPSVASAIESAWWPVKITDSQLPTFLVPIQPKWANELFDEPASLYPRKDKLGISREHVYYRKPSERGQRAPGRLLWYMTADDKGQGSAVIGCSRLDEVIRRPADDVYARFHHLGVYERSQVRESTLHGNVEALRFSDTEIFPHPVPLRRLTVLAARHGRTPYVRSLTRISSELFQDVYQEGHTHQ